MINKGRGKFYNLPLIFGPDRIILVVTLQPLSLETFEIFHSSSCRAGREGPGDQGRGVEADGYQGVGATPFHHVVDIKPMAIWEHKKARWKQGQRAFSFSGGPEESPSGYVQIYI